MCRPNKPMITSYFQTLTIEDISGDKDETITTEQSYPIFRSVIEEKISTKCTENNNI